MKFGKRVDRWIEELHTAPLERRIKVAGFLSSLSEHFFEGRKFSDDLKAELVSKLWQLRDDPEVSMRECVAQLTGLTGYHSELTEKLLSYSLGDEEADVRMCAAFACGFIGKASPVFWSNLLSHSTDRVEAVRWRVVCSLKLIRPTQHVEEPLLLDLLQDSSERVRLYAFSLASRCVKNPSPKFVKVVANALQFHDCPAATACDVVAEVDWDWTELRQSLVLLVQNAPPGIQLSAVHALLARFPGARTWPDVQNWIASNPGYWWTKEGEKAES